MTDIVYMKEQKLKRKREKKMMRQKPKYDVHNKLICLISIIGITFFGGSSKSACADWGPMMPP